MSSERVRAAAAALVVDIETAEVVRALREEDIEPILLKGATNAALLYPDAVRQYVDSDLLIDPARKPAATGILRCLGYEPELEDADVPDYHRDMWHAQPWRRPSDGARVDLHVRLMDTTIPPADVWRIVSQTTEPFRVGDTHVAMLDAPGRALLTALHAAHHGPAQTKPIADLERAVALHDLGVWRRAADLAARLGATRSLALGLRLTGAGAALAEELGLAATPPADAATDLEHSFARAFRRVTEERSTATRLRILRELLFPSAGWLERAAGEPLHGRRLARAYITRLFRLAAHAGPSLRAWRRGR